MFLVINVALVAEMHLIGSVRSVGECQIYLIHHTGRNVVSAPSIKHNVRSAEKLKKSAYASLFRRFYQTFLDLV